MSFFLFFLFFSLLYIERERESIQLGVGRNSLKVYLSFRRIPLENIFLFYGLADLFILALAWRYGFFLSKILSTFFTRSLARDSSHLFTMTSVAKLIFLFPISADRRRGLFPLWDSSQSFGFYLLPSPVRWFVRTTICPCTPFFTHPVTECTHLLVSILTWICYLRNWPRFLFQRSVLAC